MYNDSLNNHICNNTANRERGATPRREMDAPTPLPNMSTPMPHHEYGEHMRCEDMHREDMHREWMDDHAEHRGCGRNRHDYCDMCENRCRYEKGGTVYSLDVQRAAMKNKNFRTSVWTGEYLQMTLMSIPCGDDIGIECHADTDQFLRVEKGGAIAVTNRGAGCHHEKVRLCEGDGIFIPAGTRHNIINCGRGELLLSSIYGPPNHPRCTVEKYKH